MDVTDKYLEAIYSEKWTKHFVGICRSKYSNVTDPIDLMEEARQKLALSFSMSTNKTMSEEISDGYISVSFRNAVIDILRKKIGRVTASPWLRALKFGQMIFELYCLRGFSRYEVIRSLLTGMAAKEGNLSEHQLGEVITEMDKKNECTQKKRENISLNDENSDIPAASLATNDTPDTTYQVEQAEALISYIFQSGSVDNFSDARELAKLLVGLREKGIQIDLDGDQKFILHATLAGKITEAEMGKALRLSVRQVRYKRETAKNIISKTLTRLGVELGDLMNAGDVD